MNRLAHCAIGTERTYLQGIGMANSRRDPPDETAALLTQLAEALTALGTYLEISDHVFCLEPRPRLEALGEAIKNSLGQSKRANEIARRLRELMHDNSADEDN